MYGRGATFACLPASSAGWNGAFLAPLPPFALRRFPESSTTQAQNRARTSARIRTHAINSQISYI